MKVRSRLWRRLLPMAWVAVVIGVAPGISGGNLSDTPAVPEAPLAVARAAADDLGARLRALLTAELARGGPQGAVEACAAQAQEATLEEAARHGVALRRVSLQLSQSCRCAGRIRARSARTAGRGGAAGESAGRGRPSDGRPGRRVGAALPAADRAGAAVPRLPRQGRRSSPPASPRSSQQRYPGDLATGYAAGDLRGAISVRVALPKDLPAAATSGGALR